MRYHFIYGEHLGCFNFTRCSDFGYIAKWNYIIGDHKFEAFNSIILLWSMIILPPFLTYEEIVLSLGSIKYIAPKMNVVLIILDMLSLGDYWTDSK